MKKNTVVITILLLFLTLFLSGCAYLVFSKGMVQLHEENGFLENLQVFFLFLALCVFLVHSLFIKKSNPLFSFGGAFLCLAFILREVDVQTLDIAQILIVLGSGKGRNILIGVLGIVLFVYALRHFRDILSLFPQILFEHFSLLFLLGMLLLVAGGVFDKELIPVPHSQFFEEALELAGYYCMFCSALVLGTTERQE